MVLFWLLVGLTLGYLIGHYRRELMEAQRKLRAKPEQEAFVTRDDSLFTNEGMAGKTPESAIVMPKTPQQVDWEEQLELERINGFRK